MVLLVVRLGRDTPFLNKERPSGGHSVAAGCPGDPFSTLSELKIQYLKEIISTRAPDALLRLTGVSQENVFDPKKKNKRTTLSHSTYHFKPIDGSCSGDVVTSKKVRGSGR